MSSARLRAVIIQKSAQDPELPFRSQILNKVDELQPQEIEFDLFRWHGVLLVPGSPVGRLAPELCCRVFRHLRFEKLIEQRCDIGCIRVTGQHLVDEREHGLCK